MIWYDMMWYDMICYGTILPDAHAAVCGAKDKLENMRRMWEYVPNPKTHPKIMMASAKKLRQFFPKNEEDLTHKMKTTSPKNEDHLTQK